MGPGRWRKNHPYMFSFLTHGFSQSQFGRGHPVFFGSTIQAWVDDESFGISVFRVAGRRQSSGVQSAASKMSGLQEPKRDDADIRSSFAGTILVGLVGVEPSKIIRFDNDHR